MKKNKNIFMASVLLLSLGLASCTDSFLDVTSKTESSTGTGTGFGSAVVNSCISFDIIAHADGYVAGALS